jgi:catabolite regulation protein CreA
MITEKGTKQIHPDKALLFEASLSLAFKNLFLVKLIDRGRKILFIYGMFQEEPVILFKLS